jgi:hypothetical protein
MTGERLFCARSSLAAEGLGAEYCKVLEFVPAENRFLVRAGVGWDHSSPPPERLRWKMEHLDPAGENDWAALAMKVIGQRFLGLGGSNFARVFLETLFAPHSPRCCVAYQRRFSEGHKRLIRIHNAQERTCAQSSLSN